MRGVVRARVHFDVTDMAVHEGEHARSIVVRMFPWRQRLMPRITVRGREFLNQDRSGRDYNGGQLAPHDPREHPRKGLFSSKDGVSGIESVAGKAGIGLKMLALR